MKSIGTMTHAELAAFVQTCLRGKGVDVVLSGGACVSIYSRNRYVSMDLDLINVRSAKWSVIRSAMHEVGFSEKGRYFMHPDTAYLVEFPSGPLAIGEEPVRGVAELQCSTGLLRMISPTDCVKDRLSGYYHWNDLQCLEQAALVAKDQTVDMGEIERWSKAEGKMALFEQIKERLLKSASR